MHECAGELASGSLQKQNAKPNEGQGEPPARLVWLGNSPLSSREKPTRNWLWFLGILWGSGTTREMSRYPLKLGAQRSTLCGAYRWLWVRCVQSSRAAESGHHAVSVTRIGLMPLPTAEKKKGRRSAPKTGDSKAPNWLALLGPQPFGADGIDFGPSFRGSGTTVTGLQTGYAAPRDP